LVQQGQQIAEVGATGKATAPHLHFEIRKGEMAQDPLLYLPQVRVASSGQNARRGPAVSSIE
ncbi:MAG TPA: M23 family metallopeptidase, partial [Oligoflexia bacterium]|nr:M23 family metallopeptidase [Oligoflexia bacterium]